MSLILIYFEKGKQCDIVIPGLPIVFFKTTIRTGSNKAWRPAYVLTDGHSSERFLAFGKKVIARKGEELRRTFAIFLTERLKAGVSPHFIFETIKGQINEQITLTIEKQIDVNLAELESLLARITPHKLIRVLI